MQALKQHKLLVLVVIVLVAVLIVSAAGIVLLKTPSSPATTPTPPPSPTPAPSPTPQEVATPSSEPTVPLATPRTYPQNSGSPGGSSGGLFPGEVSQYQGQDLTPISTYISYLDSHPDVAIAGVQNIDQHNYRLKISGMVNTPQSLNYSEVVYGYTPKYEVSTLPCVEGWSVTLLWQGVAITDLLNHAGISSEANTIIFIAADGYSSSLPLQYIKDHNLMIAYKMNNLTFTPQLGWPFFLVAINQYGYKWVEWITEINVSNDSTYRGYWESRGYPNDAPVQNPSGSSVGGSNLGLVGLVGVMVGVAVVASVVLVRRQRRIAQCQSLRLAVVRLVRRKGKAG